MQKHTNQKYLIYLFIFFQFQREAQERLDSLIKNPGGLKPPKRRDAVKTEKPKPKIELPKVTAKKKVKELQEPLDENDVIKDVVAAPDDGDGGKEVIDVQYRPQRIRLAAFCFVLCMSLICCGGCCTFGGLSY